MTGYLIYGIHWGNLKLFLLQYLQIAANSFIQGNLWDEWCWSVFHSAPCYLFKFLERKVKWFTREEPEYRLGFTLICQQFKTQAWHFFGAISVPIVPLASVIPKFPIHFQVTKKNFLSWGFLVYVIMKKSTNGVFSAGSPCFEYLSRLLSLMETMWACKSWSKTNPCWMDHAIKGGKLISLWPIFHYFRITDAF